MKLSDFSYNLPEELIAQVPGADRQMSRLLLLEKSSGKISHDIFKNITKYINEGDCLVMNDTKVIPARLFGKRKDTMGAVEFVLLRDHGDDVWEVLTRPGHKALPGRFFVFGQDGSLEAEVLEVLEGGNRKIRFSYKGIFLEILDRTGVIPLPPYIKEKIPDPDRYQTVYAKYPGSAAAPTAGLHFTDDLLETVSLMGVSLTYITLHIGLGTFRPVKTENIFDHRMHTEIFTITDENCDIINNTLKNKKRVIAVGTTSCRALEAAAGNDGFVHPCNGETDIFIYPGYRFRIVDEMITNFHLPGSTLLMLVSALSSRDQIMKAYEEAIRERYRFYSLGDAMFIYNGEKIHGQRI